MNQSSVRQPKVPKRMGDAVVNSLMMYGLAIVIAVLAAFLIRGIVIALERRHGLGQASLSASGGTPAGPMSSRPLPRAPEPTGGGSGTAGGGPEDVDEAHVAAISAAVYAVLGAHRIVRIAPAAGTQSSGWAAQGRWMHHTTRRKPSR